MHRVPPCWSYAFPNGPTRTREGRNLNPPSFVKGRARARQGQQLERRYSPLEGPAKRVRRHSFCAQTYQNSSMPFEGLRDAAIGNVPVGFGCTGSFTSPHSTVSHRLHGDR